MKRLDFLKRLGLGAAAAVVAPKALAAALEQPEVKYGKGIVDQYSDRMVMSTDCAVTGGEMSNIRWMDVDGQKCWYYPEEAKVQQQFYNARQEEFEKMILGIV